MVLDQRGVWSPAKEHFNAGNNVGGGYPGAGRWSSTR